MACCTSFLIGSYISIQVVTAKFGRKYYCRNELKQLFKPKIEVECMSVTPVNETKIELSIHYSCDIGSSIGLRKKCDQRLMFRRIHQ